MLCIKTGMRNEYDIAKRYASWDRTLVLTGKQTLNDLLEHVPKTCTAIMSFGMCGGLRPGVVVGQTVIASYLIGPNGDNYPCNSAWQHNLFKKTHHFVQPYYSSGKFNQANTQEQRAAIHKKTGAWCIDDESLFVAQFAVKRGIPFAIARNLSDQWDDDVSVTAGILNSQGEPQTLAVLGALFKAPITMVKIGLDYRRSQAGLKLLAEQIGPDFGWKDF
jgi:adenosylhomocysteine nucleosidase